MQMKAFLVIIISTSNNKRESNVCSEYTHTPEIPLLLTTRHKPTMPMKSKEVDFDSSYLRIHNCIRVAVHVYGCKTD